MACFTSIMLLLVLSISALLFPVRGASNPTTKENGSSAFTMSTITLSTQVVSAAVLSTNEPIENLRMDSSDIVAQAQEDIWERGFDASLLLTYDLRCDTTDAANMPQPKGSAARYSKNTMVQGCKTWWSCNPLTGAKIPNGRPPQRGGWGRGQWDFCDERCTCEAVDVPRKHYHANFGCMSPQGGWVSGGVGSISRGESAPIDIGDGLKLQAYHGPARKE